MQMKRKTIQSIALILLFRQLKFVLKFFEGDFSIFHIKIQTFSLKIFDELIRIIFICIFHFKFAEVPGLP